MRKGLRRFRLETRRVVFYAGVCLFVGWTALLETPHIWSAQERVDRAISTSIDVRPAAMIAPAGEDWLSYHGDYSGRRFSGLAEITPANVSQLKAQWVFHVRDASDLEVTPVVAGGIMFVTAATPMRSTPGLAESCGIIRDPSRKA
jgi:glucose dehydrogenase